MGSTKRVDDFLKALDKTQVVLTKERLQPSVAPKTIDLKNYPDLGNTVTPEYSSTEKAIQNAEILDSLISNVGVAADVARKLPLGPSLTKATNVISKVGKIAEPVQMALWSADAARTISDPEYRNQSKIGVEQMLDEDRASPTKAALKAISSILSRPVGTISGLLSTSDQIALDQINQDLKGASLDRQAKDRADKEAVPEITPKTIERDRALKYFNR